jgi:hypothetical protein
MKVKLEPSRNRGRRVYTGANATRSIRPMKRECVPARPNPPPSFGVRGSFRTKLKVHKARLGTLNC